MNAIQGALLLLSVLILCGLLFLVAQPAQAGCSPSWDRDFRKATRTFMPAPVKRHWKWVKAQTIVESACRPEVCSHVGACGLLQVMPGTWKDLTGREPGTSIFEPKLNLIQGTRYQAWQVGQWLGRPRSPAELYELGMAGYNAGLGHILKAQAACGGARTWEGVKPCLPGITGKNARETFGYIERHRRWRKQLGD